MSNEKSKTPSTSYTAEQVAEMREVYCAAESDDDRAAAVELLAARFGRKAQSVRMKLVREGVYVAKAYKAKDGNAPITKEQLVSNIAEAIGTDNELVGLERAAKNTLRIILDAVNGDSQSGE